MQRRPRGRRVRKINISILQGRESLSNHHAVIPSKRSLRREGSRRAVRSRFCDAIIARLARFLVAIANPAYPNLAVMEILAFRTFDTGQPFSAASAYF
jgi:hypothetical protein